MQIDLLYFDDCPSWEPALANLKSALAAEKIKSKIHLIRIESPEDAIKEKFLGSPSFRVNGQDLWPEGSEGPEGSEERQSYQLSCRIYATPDGMRGAPSYAMLVEKLHVLHAGEMPEIGNPPE